MSALRFIDVSHAYGGQRAVHEVSFDLARAEMICLLGPSGCGKTTLLRLAAGLELLQQGRIEIGGQAAADSAGGLCLPPDKRQVGLCFQDFALFPHLSVMDNILFGVGSGRAERKAWALDMLERLGLGARHGAYPHMLSGGEQQRIALLRAMAPAPDVLLLDEPFSSLDTNLRTQTREETLNLIKSSGRAAMMVTHDAEEAMFMADRILVMNGGRIVQAGAPARIYSHPADPFVASLFGPVNRLEGRVRAGRVETALGSFAADGHAEGAKVQVLIRPEGLTPVRQEQQDTGPCTAEVVSAHFLGGSSHLHLRRHEGGDLLHIDCQARIPGTYLPPEGARIAFEIDPSSVHIFPA